MRRPRISRASIIDYMVSDEAAAMWAAAGYLPAVALADPSKVKMSGVLTDGDRRCGRSSTPNNALGHYPDWASPTLLKTIDDNMPCLLAEQADPGGVRRLARKGLPGLPGDAEVSD